MSGGQQQMLAMGRALMTDPGLIVEQNAREALRNSDRGYVIEMGENRFEDTGDALLDNDEVADPYLGGGA